MNWQTIGFKAQKKYLEQAAKADNLAHAYLFTGNDMIGKQMFARKFCIGVGGFEPPTLAREARLCRTELHSDANLKEQFTTS